MKDYLWQRYWYKRGDDPTIINGFLNLWGKYESTALTFDKFSEIPCLVLLGEPGMGKSNEIKKIYNTHQCDLASKHYLNLSSVPDPGHLYRKLFDLEKLKDWKKGKGNLYLFLDSLDEALLNITTLSGILADEIGELPTERLFLRLACRAAEWSNLSKFEKKLQEVWKEEKFQILNLAPLQRKDVIEAAKIEGKDGDRFLDEVFEKNVAPLAAKPVSLKLLLGIFNEDSKLPSTQSELYERGCLALCEEDLEDRPVAKRDILTAEQRFRVAARIAALMILSNKSSIWINRDTGEQTDADISIKDLSGHFEKNKDETDFYVDENVIRETIHKGLFTNNGNGRIKFEHQTYSEFLTSWYLSYKNISDEKIIELLGNKSLYPQLYETAAWIANRKNGVFKHLLEIAPMILLRSDVLSTKENFKSLITKKILKNFEAEKSFNNDEYQYLRKLNHSNITKQLRPYIKNKYKRLVARIAALNIARVCKVKELQADLLNLALDEDDNSYPRRLAILALEEVGDKSTISQLEPLIYINVNDEKNFELKFYALDALWRENISAEKLFDALDEHPSGHSYFISHKLSKKLEKEDLPIALDWLEKTIKLKGHLSYDMQSLADEILFKAWDNLDKKEILTKFTAVAIENFKTYQDIFKNDISNEEFERINQDVINRKRVLLEMLTYVKKEDDWLNISYSRILCFRLEDTKWMIEEWRNSTNLSIQLKILSILKGWVESAQFYYSKGASPEFLDEIWREYEQNEYFRAEFSSFFKPIYLDSEEASLYKNHYCEMQNKRRKWEVKEEAEKLLQPSPKDRVLDFLSKFESGDIEAWWQINYWMMFLPNGHGIRSESDLNLTKFPVWKELEEETREGIVQTAKVYLKEGNPQTEKWIDNAEPYRPAIAGYRAIRLLSQFEPEYVETISKDIWLKWSPAIYFAWIGSESGNYEKHQKILNYIYKLAPQKIAELLSKEIDRENKKKHPFLNLYRLEFCWDKSLGKVLKDKLINSKLAISLFNEMLSHLFYLNDEDAEAIACKYIKYPIPKREKSVEQMNSCLRLLLQYGKTKCWKKIWNILNKDNVYGKSIVESALYRNVSRNEKSKSDFPEKEAADFFLWLTKNYPHNEDPIHKGSYSPTARDEIVHWRDSFVYYLRDKGTKKSVLQLKRIKKELPKLEFLKSVIVNAQENERARNWKPNSPQQLFKVMNIESSNLKQIMKNKILFLTSNPLDTPRLRIEQEARDIEEGLRRSNKRDYFEFKIRLATRPRDLSRAILDESPQILHFSGHGEIDGILLEDENGISKLVTTNAISSLFSLFSDSVKCVILNSCYSESQAQEISKHIPFVIGMSKAIPDDTAIAFATSFYDAIGAGRDFEFAFNFGVSNINLEGLSGDEIPILIKKS